MNTIIYLVFLWEAEKAVEPHETAETLEVRKFTLNVGSTIESRFSVPCPALARTAHLPHMLLFQ